MTGIIPTTKASLLASMAVFGITGASRLAAVTFESLLQEMASRDALASFPEPRYRSLQASSYNRLSTARDQPDQGTGGWFADSDGVGFIRTEEINGGTEWVVMEHDGPGALTRFWTPFFYYDFNNRSGPRIRVYLDGSSTPVIDQNFIELLTNLAWGPEYGGKPAPQNTLSAPAPFAGFTARAGVLHLPVPFASSCKVTMTGKPFYNIINYRAYPPGTPVTPFTTGDLSSPALAAAGAAVGSPADFAGGTLHQGTGPVPAGGEVALSLPAGAAAVRHLEVDLDETAVAAAPGILRSLVLSATFDGEETVWCPVGDFFSSSNRLNHLETWTRGSAPADGRLACRWVMPYAGTATVRLVNLGATPVAASLTVRTGEWAWDDRSMHFHANWRPDDVVPGTPFEDWNFIDIRGKGVFVGDSWTVLNLTTGWWGEGDEKIYVDDEYDVARFPSHFGTGTEDYYGWAGGVNPIRNDEFSNPWEANAQVGSRASDSTEGFNVNTRTRTLSAIPFDERLVFDMEASAGTGQRNAWNLLMYSSAVFWYARPGATHNRPPLPAQAARPITSFEELQAQSDLIKAGGVLVVPNAIEAEDLVPSACSPGVTAVAESPPAGQNPGLVLSHGRHLMLPFTAAGQFVEFRFTEQFTRKRLRVRLSTLADYGRVDVAVNGLAAAADVDLFSTSLGVDDLDLGEFDPVESAVTIRVTSAGAGPDGGFAAAVDAFVLTDPPRPGLQVTTDFDFRDNSCLTVFDTAAYGAGPVLEGGRLAFDGTTALQAPTATVFGGTAPADNFGYEVIVTPSALDAFDIAAGVVDAAGSNSGSFLFQQAGAWRLIESAEGAAAGTTAPAVGTTVALAFVMDNGTARLFVNGAEETSRAFTAGGATPIDTATLAAVVLGGNLFDNGEAPGGGSALGAFNGTIDRFRAFVFDPGQFDASQLLGPGDGTNDFTSWIDGYHVGDQTGLADDPDGDRIANGVENFFGTRPDQFSGGLSLVSSSGESTTFRHPLNPTPAGDLTGRYEWSLDLASYHLSGATVDGTTVMITSTPGSPIPGFATVTATLTGQSPGRLFLRIAVVQEA